MKTLFIFNILLLVLFNPIILAATVNPISKASFIRKQRVVERKGECKLTGNFRVYFSYDNEESVDINDIICGKMNDKAMDLYHLGEYLCTIEDFDQVDKENDECYKHVIGYESILTNHIPFQYTKTVPKISTTTTITTTISTTTITLSTSKLPLTTSIPATTTINCIPVTITEKEEVTITEKEKVTVTEKEKITVTEKETVTLTEKETVTFWVSRTVDATPTSTTVILNTTTSASATETSIPNDEYCAGKWDQCGGKGFKGPNCCKSGLTCVANDEFYSQCI